MKPFLALGEAILLYDKLLFPHSYHLLQKCCPAAFLGVKVSGIQTWEMTACRCVDMHYKSQSKSPAMVSYSCSSSGLCCIVVYCSCSKLSCVLLFPWLSQTGEIRLQPGYSPLWILSVGLLVFTHFKERCMSSTNLDWCGTKTLRTEDKSVGKGSKTSFLLGVWQFLCAHDLSSLKPNMKK